MIRYLDKRGLGLHETDDAGIDECLRLVFLALGEDIDLVARHALNSISASESVRLIESRPVACCSAWKL